MWILEGEKEGNSRVKCTECTDKMKEDRGCNSDIEWWKKGVKGCPEKYVTPTITKLINMWVKYKKWGLPFPEHWSEQPYWVIDTIEILDFEEKKYYANKGKK